MEEIIIENGNVYFKKNDKIIWGSFSDEPLRDEEWHLMFKWLSPERNSNDRIYLHS